MVLCMAISMCEQLITVEPFMTTNPGPNNFAMIEETLTR